jgi:hypothetical protein
MTELLHVLALLGHLSDNCSLVENHRTALVLKTIHFYASAVSLFTIKYVCLRIKLSLSVLRYFPFAASTFLQCIIYVYCQMQRCIIITWICCLYMSVCYILLYLRAPFLCMFSIVGRIFLVWAFSVFSAMFSVRCTLTGNLGISFDRCRYCCYLSVCVWCFHMFWIVFVCERLLLFAYF